AAALAVVLAVLVLLVVISFAHARRVESASSEAAETQRVLVQLQRLATGVEQTETAVRGYLLTGKPEYLQRLYAGRVRSPGLIALFCRMASVSPCALALLACVAAAYHTLTWLQDALILA